MSVSTTTELWCMSASELAEAIRTKLGFPRAFRRAYREGFTAPTSRAELEAPCPTLLVAGEKEAIVRASDAALAALMPHATARFVPGLGHAWFHVAARPARAHGRGLDDRKTAPRRTQT